MSSLYQVNAGNVTQATDVNQLTSMLDSVTTLINLNVAGRIGAAMPPLQATGGGMVGGMAWATYVALTADPDYLSALIQYAAPPLVTSGSFAVGDTMSDAVGLLWECVATGVTNTWQSIGNGGGFTYDRMYATGGFTFQGSEATPYLKRDPAFGEPGNVPLSAKTVDTGSFSAFYVGTTGYYLTGCRFSGQTDGAKDFDVHLDLQAAGQPYGQLGVLSVGEHQSMPAVSGGHIGGCFVDLVSLTAGQAVTSTMTVTPGTVSMESGNRTAKQHQFLALISSTQAV